MKLYNDKANITCEQDIIILCDFLTRCHFVSVKILFIVYRIFFFFFNVIGITIISISKQNAINATHHSRCGN